MNKTRIKICGLTRPQDIACAIQEGADALGFVLYAKSPRYVNGDKLKDLLVDLPPFVTPVLLFVNASSSEVRHALEIAPFSMLQFHGDESSEFCEQFSRPYLRAARMQAKTNLVQYREEFKSAAALLLDSFSSGYGGSGESFDWSLIPTNANCRLVLSGGLCAANVGAGIAAVRPWAVDVSSGVEAEKGIKDPQKIKAFVRSVRLADDGLYSASR